MRSVLCATYESKVSRPNMRSVPEDRTLRERRHPICTSTTLFRTLVLLLPLILSTSIFALAFDLRPVDILVSPSGPYYAGQTKITVRVEVENNCSQSACNCTFDIGNGFTYTNASIRTYYKIRLSLNGQVKTTINRYFMPCGGDSSTYYLTAFVPAHSGELLLTVEVDSANHIPETRESNNTRTERITIEPAQVTVLPDLVVSKIRVDGTTNTRNYYVGERVKVECLVENLGPGDAEKTRVGYYVGRSTSSATYWEDDSVSPLQAGDSLWRNEYYTFKPSDVGRRYFVCTADYPNDFDEKKDGNNSRVFGPFQVVSPPPLAASAGNDQQIDCFNPCVAISGSSTGGVPPYAYSWTPGGARGAQITLCSPGTYVLTVTDSLGQQAVDSITITGAFEAPTVHIIDGQELTCSTTPTLLDATVQGGSEPYDYSWSPGGQTTEDIVVDSPGTYTLTVTGANGCMASDSVTVTVDVAVPVVDAGADQELTCSAAAVLLDATVQGGPEPYDYLWSPGGESTEDISVSRPGKYTLLVTSANGCTVSDSCVVRLDRIGELSSASHNRWWYSPDALFEISLESCWELGESGLASLRYYWGPDLDNDAQMLESSTALPLSWTGGEFSAQQEGYNHFVLWGEYPDGTRTKSEEYGFVYWNEAAAHARAEALQDEIDGSCSSNDIQEVNVDDGVFWGSLVIHCPVNLVFSENSVWGGSIRIEEAESTSISNLKLWWGALDVDGSMGVTLSNIEFGDSRAWDTGEGTYEAAIRINDSSVALQQCLVSGEFDGVLAVGDSFLEVSNCEFEETDTDIRLLHEAVLQTSESELQGLVVDDQSSESPCEFALALEIESERGVIGAAGDSWADAPPVRVSASHCLSVYLAVVLHHTEPEHSIVLYDGELCSGTHEIGWSAASEVADATMPGTEISIVLSATNQDGCTLERRHTVWVIDEPRIGYLSSDSHNEWETTGNGTLEIEFTPTPSFDSASITAFRYYWGSSLASDEMKFSSSESLPNSWRQGEFEIGDTEGEWELLVWGVDSTGTKITESMSFTVIYTTRSWIIGDVSSPTHPRWSTTSDTTIAVEFVPSDDFDASQIATFRHYWGPNLYDYQAAIELGVELPTSWRQGEFQLTSVSNDWQFALWGVDEIGRRITDFMEYNIRFEFETADAGTISSPSHTPWRYNTNSLLEIEFAPSSEYAQLDISTLRCYWGPAIDDDAAMMQQAIYLPVSWTSGSFEATSEGEWQFVLWGEREDGIRATDWMEFGFEYGSGVASGTPEGGTGQTVRVSLIDERPLLIDGNSTIQVSNSAHNYTLDGWIPSPSDVSIRLFIDGREIPMTRSVEVNEFRDPCYYFRVRWMSILQPGHFAEGSYVFTGRFSITTDRTEIPAECVTAHGPLGIGYDAPGPVFEVSRTIQIVYPESDN